MNIDNQGVCYVITEAAELSTAYGRLFIGNGFILNGGALIALPAFHSDDLGKMISASGWMMPAWFVLGLFCASCTATLAHLQAKRLLAALELVATGRKTEAEMFAQGGNKIIVAIWISGAPIYVAFFSGSMLSVSRAALHYG